MGALPDVWLQGREKSDRAARRFPADHVRGHDHLHGDSAHPVHHQAHHPLAEPAASINFIKNKGVLAGLFVILLCVLFVAFFDSLGYVVVGMLLCGIIMWLIGKRNIVELLLVSILVPLGMWLVFYKMLSVNIPMGVLQPLRDLVDMIHF